MCATYNIYTWAIAQEWALSVDLGKMGTWVLTRQWAFVQETTVSHLSRFLMESQHYSKTFTLANPFNLSFRAVEGKRALGKTLGNWQSYAG